jgi:hypothetical protein
MCFQSFTVQCECALAQARHFFTCSCVNNRCFTALHLWMPPSHSRRLIVCSLASMFDRFLSPLSGMWVSDSALHTLHTRYRTAVAESIHGLPDQGRFLSDLCFRVRSTKLVIVVWEMPNCSMRIEGYQGQNCTLLSVCQLMLLCYGRAGIVCWHLMMLISDENLCKPSLGPH